jgi:hypothetical protein
MVMVIKEVFQYSFVIGLVALLAGALLLFQKNWYVRQWGSEKTIEHMDQSHNPFIQSQKFIAQSDIFPRLARIFLFVGVISIVVGAIFLSVHLGS